MKDLVCKGIGTNGLSMNIVQVRIQGLVKILCHIISHTSLSLNKLVTISWKNTAEGVEVLEDMKEMLETTFTDIRKLVDQLGEPENVNESS